MVQEIWNVAGYHRPDAVALTQQGLNPLVAVLLVSRGICEPEDIQGLFCEDPSLLADPLLLTGMDRAVARIQSAIEAGEHVAVYGDYDVDGITATCLLSRFLREKGLECEIYIPERLESGYGVKEDGLDKLISAGVTLTITVDCGVTAAPEVEYAKARGMDMIITDHHECGAALPDAVAVIDPKRHDDRYPGKALAGVGVAFKLVCAVEGQAQLSRLLAEYSELVAVGTVADVMPVTGENRILIKHGIKAIQAQGRCGIVSLCRAAGLDEKQLTVSNIGFVLAPRLNAAGRLGKTQIAVDLLMSEDPVEADALAEALCALNRDRQQMESEMFTEALHMLEKENTVDAPIVLSSGKWHQGVAGIAASRLSERFSLPAIVICLQDGQGHGSCRSCGGFNIFNALEYCSDLLETFGGHDMAAGLTVAQENIPAFKEKLCRYFKEKADPNFVPSLDIDFEVINPALLTVGNIDALNILEPFGTGNPTPLLSMTDVRVEAVTPLSGGKHTKLRISKLGAPFECVFFSQPTDELGVSPGDRLDIAFTPQINEYKGRRTVQLLLSATRATD